jgi:HlyD family secretion protein
MCQPRPKLRTFSRTGFSSYTFLLAIPLVLAIGAVAWSMLPGVSWGTKEATPLMYRVERGDFIHDITERGELLSASNVEIRCEVQSRNSAGTTILEVIPEGTYVEEGQILVRLDDSALKTEETQQQIACNASEAAMIQSRNAYETAKIALQEYLDGKYIQEKQTIEGEILVAKEDARRAQQTIDYSKMLFSKGYVTKLQLEADEFALEKAKMAQKTAETKLHVLENFTKPKMLTQLESDIKTTEAKYKSDQHSRQLDIEKLELIRSQIAKCVIRAPGPGQVVYANDTNRRGGNEIVIQEGVQVRERQAIIRLPDPKRMQVNAKINEAKIALVATGMPASVRLDAFPDRELSGVVEKVSEYPAATSWFNSSIKEYETLVRIETSVEGMRPGLTAEVKIRVAHLKDVLQVPVQAVLEHGDRHYCLMFHQGRWEARTVELGPTNDKQVVIRAGLNEGDNVVLGALAYRDKVALPEARLMPQSQAPAAATEQAPAAPTATGATPAPASPAAPSADRAAPGGQPDPAQLFARLDKNGDQRLEVGELPEPLQATFSAADTNGDKALDLNEWTAAAKRFAGRPRKAKPPAEGRP